MRAVNLLPPDLRRAAPTSAPDARREKVEGFGAFLVLGTLALCVAALAAYVLTTNTVEQKQADLEAVKERAAAASARAAQLKPYADFEAMALARQETVRGLAGARFDWERALRDLARAVPGDVKLQTLNGDMGLPGAQGSGDPLRGSIQAPAISLGGCAETQVSVARLMSRVKAVDGVTRVSLSKSEKTGSGTESPCAGDQPPTFSMVIFFEGNAAAAAMVPAEATAAAASVPVPSAVNQSQPAQGGAPGTDGTAGEATDGGATGDAGTTPANPSTTTTTGSTP